MHPQIEQYEREFAPYFCETLPEFSVFVAFGISSFELQHKICRVYMLSRKVCVNSHFVLELAHLNKPKILDILIVVAAYKIELYLRLENSCCWKCMLNCKISCNQHHLCLQVNLTGGRQTPSPP